MVNLYLKKLLITEKLKFEDGKILINGVPMIMSTAHVLAYQNKMLGNTKEGSSILYICGFIQGYKGAKFCMKSYRYKNLKEAYKLLSGQSDMLGYGKIFYEKIDFKNFNFVTIYESALAKEYLNTFGKSNYAIDYWLRGQMAGLAAALGNVNFEDILTIETHCIAKGDKFCRLVTKKRSEFDLKNKIIKRQIPMKLPWPKEKGQEKKTKALPRRAL